MTSAPATLEARGVTLVGFHDLEGYPGFKLAMHRAGDQWFLYAAHVWRSGWSIVDVTDPAAPKLVRYIRGPEHTWTLQVQVAENRLVTALERPPPGWGVDHPELAEEGVIIWDLGADPTAPELLGVHRTGAVGTHRNYYAGGSLAYLSASLPGMRGRSLQIIDISDAECPREVGRWAWPGQDDATKRGFASYMHGPAYVEGNLAYVSYGKVGLVILDVSDPSRPVLVGHLSFGDLGSRVGCHSAVPLKGRDLLVVNAEAISEGVEGEFNYAFVVDVSDPSVPRVLSSLPPPVPSRSLPYRSYHRKPGRFGPHNQHHFQNTPSLLDSRDVVYMTWFNAGLRVYDLTDPWDPVEVGAYVPADPTQRRGPLPRALVTQFEDVVVDARGFIYCSDKNHGLFVARYRAG